MAPRLSVSYSFSAQVAYNHLKLQAEEPNALCWPQRAPTNTWCTHTYRSTRIHTQKYLSYFFKKRQGKHQIVRQLLSKPSILVSGPLYFLQVGGTRSEITIGSPAW